MDRIIGAALAVLGVAVAVVAVIALHNPRGREAGTVTPTVATSPSVLRPTSSAPGPTPRPSKT
jgi:hypothetical protein